MLFAGSTEIQMLLWAVVLGLVQLVIATSMATLDQGLPYNLSPRDLPAPPVKPVTARLQRAFHNFRETFVYFAVAVLVVTALGKTNANSALGAEIYLAARVLYVPIYAAGIPALRTLIWAASVVGIVMVLLERWLSRKHSLRAKHAMERQFQRAREPVSEGESPSSRAKLKPEGVTRMPALDDGRHLVGQFGHGVFAVPGDLGLGEDRLLHFARQIGPGRDHATAQPAHQAFILGRIFELLFFRERHALPFFKMVDDVARGRSGDFVREPQSGEPAQPNQ